MRKRKRVGDISDICDGFPDIDNGFSEYFADAAINAAIDDEISLTDYVQVLHPRRNGGSEPGVVADDLFSTPTGPRGTVRLPVLTPASPSGPQRTSPTTPEDARSIKKFLDKMPRGHNMVPRCATCLPLSRMPRPRRRCVTCAFAPAMNIWLCSGSWLHTAYVCRKLPSTATRHRRRSKEPCVDLTVNGRPSLPAAWGSVERRFR
jgi:hypothetical protein